MEQRENAIKSMSLPIAIQERSVFKRKATTSKE